jgi:hypothetical protein
MLMLVLVLLTSSNHAARGATGLLLQPKHSTLLLLHLQSHVLLLLIDITHPSLSLVSRRPAAPPGQALV